MTLDSIDFKFDNIKKYLNITSPQLNTSSAIINTAHPKPPNNISSRPTSSITVTNRSTQNLNNSQSTPTPASITPVASTSTATNNNNNTLTVQGLANEFNIM